MDEIVIQKIVLAMISHVAESSLPVFLEGPDGQTREAGSGTLFEIAGHYFLATAAHVIKNYPLRSIVLSPFRQPSNYSPPLTGYGWRGGEKGDPLDIAWIELEPRAAVQTQNHFLSIENFEVGTTHAPDEMAFVHGYPVERIEKDERDGETAYLSSGIGYVTGTLSVSAVETRFSPNPTIDVFLTCLKTRITTRLKDGCAALQTLLEISGGGIWRVRNNRGIWMPSHSRMIAIENSWVRGAWLRSTQAQHWLRMLVEDVPAVGGPISDMFPAILEVAS